LNPRRFGSGNLSQLKVPSLPLNPFLDENELIWVDGRIENSALPFHTKHPILLVSHSLIKMIRSLILYAGIQFTLSTLRQKYWILHTRTLVKSVLHQCVTCASKSCRSTNGPVTSRSSVRAPVRAFLHCSVDFAGPVSRSFPW